MKFKDLSFLGNINIELGNLGIFIMLFIFKDKEKNVYVFMIRYKY